MLPAVARKRDLTDSTACTRIRSEVPNDADADKKIALATLARVYIQLRHSRPEVPNFPAQAESVEDSYIETESCLEYAGGSPGLAWIRTPKPKRGTFTEMERIRQPKTDPRRNCLIGKDVQRAAGVTK